MTHVNGGGEVLTRHLLARRLVHLLHLFEWLVPQLGGGLREEVETFGSPSHEPADVRIIADPAEDVLDRFLCFIDRVLLRSAAVGARYVDLLRGYVPIGFFQLWHAQEQKEYPWSKGEAQHDDIMFAEMWPREFRRLLPSVICYHLLAEKRPWGNEWDGVRKQPRFS